MTNEFLLEIAKIGGPIALALVIIYFIVKKFLEAQKFFIGFIEKQEINFKNTIDNHLDEQAKANNELASAIKALLDYLKYHNGKGK